MLFAISLDPGGCLFLFFVAVVWLVCKTAQDPNVQRAAGNSFMDWLFKK